MDTFTPPRVHRILQEHDAEMRRIREVMGLINAIYLTRYWAWVLNRQTRTEVDLQAELDRHIEVNDLRKWVGTYRAALYPRANRSVCGPDPLGRGEPTVGSAVLNAFWQKPRTNRCMNDSVELGILGWCAFKVGYDAGTGNPIHRSWLRTVPLWEVVLDRNCTNLDDERYRGHVYYAPKEEVEARYPKLKGKLVGCPRSDFYSASTGNASPAATNNPAAPDASANQDGLFVRVLEFYNLRDDIVIAGGDTLTGRLEVYILDQAGDISDKPVVMSPLPLGDGCPNIEPLIFEHEPGFPLRPISPVERMLPQIRERNVFRTHLAGMASRDQRKGVVAANAFEQDQLDVLMNPTDMAFAVYKGDRPIGDVIKMLDQQAASQNITNWMRVTDGDHANVQGMSANARGEANKGQTTAYEVQQIQLFTESDLGYHGQMLNDVRVRVSALVLRAVAGAMRDTGDSEGAVIEEPAAATEADPEAVAVETAPKPRAVKEQTFTMKDREETITVTVEALDADFEITFVEGGRTPLTDQAMLTFLTGPAIKEYFGYFKVALSEGPEAHLARATMDNLAERADLPKDMRFEALAAAHQKAMAEAPPKPPPPAATAMQPREAAPADAPPAAPEAPPAPTPAQNGATVVIGTLQQVLAALQAILAAAPDARPALEPIAAALVAAMEAVKGNDTAGLTAAVDAAATGLGQIDAATLTPEAATALSQARATLENVMLAITGPGAAPAEPAPV